MLHAHCLQALAKAPGSVLEPKSRDWVPLFLTFASARQSHDDIAAQSPTPEGAHAGLIPDADSDGDSESDAELSASQAAASDAAANSKVSTTGEGVEAGAAAADQEAATKQVSRMSLTHFVYMTNDAQGQ